jgi:hypothetical protein
MAKRKAPIKNHLQNIDINISGVNASKDHATNFTLPNVGSYIKNETTDGGNDKSMFTDMQDVINVVTQNLKNEVRNQQINTIQSTMDRNMLTLRE